MVVFSNVFCVYSLTSWVLMCKLSKIFVLCMQREYEEFKVRVNALVAMAQKVPEEGWTMQDGTPWPGNNVRDHPGMIQVIVILSLIIISLKFCLLLLWRNCQSS